MGEKSSCQIPLCSSAASGVFSDRNMLCNLASRSRRLDPRAQVYRRLCDLDFGYHTLWCSHLEEAPCVCPGCPVMPNCDLKPCGTTHRGSWRSLQMCNTCPRPLICLVVASPVHAVKCSPVLLIVSIYALSPLPLSFAGESSVLLVWFVFLQRICSGTVPQFYVCFLLSVCLFCICLWAPVECFAIWFSLLTLPSSFGITNPIGWIDNSFKLWHFISWLLWLFPALPLCVSFPFSHVYV